ncbi:hypothetical protein [Argonema antarcticum]|uniref:hypothetical protein n=1 Tax=Argonema antarcticum TaxID=2942763 RepID=UPI002010F1E5|nr:hypothetical protein [Argonema antarcticum]MCL1469337.1 hypothetical protein [Argonema antarcticum A004/B2]
MKQLFVAWIAFHRRPVSMQSHFGYELKFSQFAFSKRYLRPLEYLVKGWTTLVLLLHKKPEAIWLQLAPTPLLYVAYLYKILFNRHVIIIADCHNVLFRAPWINLPGAVDLLNRCDLVILHNDCVKQQATAAGVIGKCLYVLEDRPAMLDCGIIEDRSAFPHPWVLFPCSFHADEPIEVVLAAARLVPDITFVLTGDTIRAKGIHNLTNIPPNVKLPGFLPTVEFDMLLCTTDAVLGLTTLEDVQVCTANEAVGSAKPLILSETKLLKKLFYKGAVYVKSDNPQSIAQGCQEAISRKAELIEQIVDLKVERNQRWLKQAEQVDALLYHRGADTSL